MFNKIPIEESKMIKLDPPYEINGKGTPVRGISATIAPKFMIVCIASHEEIPKARSLPNASAAL